MFAVRNPDVEAAFSIVVVDVDPSQARLMATGDLDLAATEQLDAILNAQQAAGRTSIRLDLSAVTFMDCACLGVLVGARHRLTAADGDLLLTNVSNPVLRLLELTGLSGSLLTSPEPGTLAGAAMRRPIRLAVVDDYAVVVAGVASFLADEHIDVVEIGASRSVVSDVDIVLFDTFGQVEGAGIDLKDFVRDSGAKVVVYSWNLQPQLIKKALDEGARGYLSKVLSGPEIVRALERVMGGELVIRVGHHETSVGGEGDWPGRAAGLSSREAEIIALITQGLSNQDIAERVHLSINSIKTYIRSAYRKMHVTTRSQAVLWGVQSGFKPDSLRTIDPALLVRPAVTAPAGRRPIT